MKGKKIGYLKGKRTEDIARKHIESLGYIHTVQTTALGPDIVGWRDGAAFFFEVKPARQTQRNCFVTGPVMPNRREDHFVAIVLPNKKVFVFPMHEHLSACGPSGVRVVTKLVREHCPESFAPKKGRRFAALRMVEILKARNEWPEGAVAK
jgi:hypothetical protein